MKTIQYVILPCLFICFSGTLLFSQYTIDNFYYDSSYNSVKSERQAAYLATTWTPADPSDKSLYVQVKDAEGKLLMKYAYSDFTKGFFKDTTTLYDAYHQIYSHTVYHPDSLNSFYFETDSNNRRIIEKWKANDIWVIRHFLENDRYMDEYFKPKEISEHHYYTQSTAHLDSILYFDTDYKLLETKVFKENGYTIKKAEGKTRIQDIGSGKVGSRYEFVERMPEYPGGTKALYTFLGSQTIYPRYAANNNISGTCYVTFMVTQEGKIQNVRVIKPTHPALDFETLRIVSLMPNWNPGYQDDKPVDVWYKLPMKFALN